MQNLDPLPQTGRQDMNLGVLKNQMLSQNIERGLCLWSIYYNLMCKDQRCLKSEYPDKVINFFRWKWNLWTGPWSVYKYRLANDFYYSSSLTLQDEVNTSSPTIVCDGVCECNGARGKSWKDC